MGGNSTMLFAVQSQLCEAIQKRVAVEFRYEQDGLYRTFEPYAVYNSTKDNVCVSGTQTKNLNKPLDRAQPRVFYLSEIRGLRITSSTFIPDARFDRFDPRYQHGIICSI
jgi:hypothetical protein